MGDLNDLAKVRSENMMSPSPPAEWLEELEAIANNRPEPNKPPRISVDPALPAQSRLAMWQEYFVARYGYSEEVCNPLKLIPNQICKDDGGLTEPLFVLNFATFCGRPLAWAMRQDPAAVEEIFSMIRPFALWLFVGSLEDPKWSKVIPEPARKRIVKLCVIERQQGQLKRLRAVLPETNHLQNLQALEFFIKPRLVSESGRQTRKFPYKMAVEYGMKPDIRLFFRWAFAEDQRVEGEDRKGRVKSVTEFVRESRPHGEDPPVVEREAAGEYPQFTYETFAAGAMCSPHVLINDLNPYLIKPAQPGN